MEDRNFTIIDEHGNEFLCEIIFTFHSDEFEKDYVVYSIPAKADEDEMEVSAACYVEHENGEGDLLPIESEQEWELVEQLLAEFEADDELES